MLSVEVDFDRETHAVRIVPPDSLEQRLAVAEIRRLWTRIGFEVVGEGGGSDVLFFAVGTCDGVAVVGAWFAVLGHWSVL